MKARAAKGCFETCSKRRNQVKLLADPPFNPQRWPTGLLSVTLKLPEGDLHRDNRFNLSPAKWRRGSQGLVACARRV